MGIFVVLRTRQGCYLGEWYFLNNFPALAPQRVELLRNTCYSFSAFKMRCEARQRWHVMPSWDRMSHMSRFADNRLNTQGYESKYANWRKEGETKGHRKQQNRRVIQRKANLCDRTSSPLVFYLAEVTFLNVLEFIDKVAMQCHRVRKVH